MWVMTKDGWVRPTITTVIPAPTKANAQTYWWMGLCPINPKDGQ